MAEEVVSLVPKGVVERVLDSECTPEEACDLVEAALLDVPRFLEIVDAICSPTHGPLKDAEVADSLREQGNDAFRRRSFKEALHYYTCAVQTAPPGTDTAARAFANRAACLEEVGDVPGAILDCGRAIEARSPCTVTADPAYGKAWLRRGRLSMRAGDKERAVGDLGEAMRLEPPAVAKAIEKDLQAARKMPASAPAAPPTAPPPGVVLGPAAMVDCVLPGGGSEKLPVASSAVEWRDTGGDGGRDLFATRALEPGEIVLVEDAFVASLDKPLLRTHCHFCCGRLPPTPVPCAACAGPLYCAEGCRDAAAPGHAHECGAAWPSALPINVISAVRMSERVAAGAAGAAIPTPGSSGAEGGGCDEDGVFRPGWRSAAAQCAHFGALREREGEEQLTLLCLAAVGAQCLRARGGAAAEGAAAGKVFTCMCQLRANVFTIKGPPPPGGGGAEGARVGEGVFPAAALANHSCEPNLTCRHFGRRLVMRTTRAVAAGEGLHHTYGPSKGGAPVAERREKLFQHYNFTCGCFACASPGVSEVAAQGLQCLADSGCAGAMPAPVSGEVEVVCCECGKSPEEGRAEEAADTVQAAKASVAAAREVLQSAASPADAKAAAVAAQRAVVRGALRI